MKVEEDKSAVTTRSLKNEQTQDKAPKRNDILLVANPSSSSGSTGKDWDDLYLKIKEAFGDENYLKVVFTEKTGDGTALTRNI